MSSFIQKQKQKIIIMMITITMMVTGIPIFISAAEVDTQAPEIRTDVRAGRIKAGSKVSFTVTDETGINNLYYLWDRNIDGKSNDDKRPIYLDERTKEYTFVIDVPENFVGLHEISVAAKDDNGNLNEFWLDVPYYIVNEEVSPDYTDKIKPEINRNRPDDYPLADSKIPLGREIKIELEDENDIYWLAYKWCRTFEEDYGDNAIVVYKPGNSYKFTAPSKPEDLGEWYLQYYVVDGSLNVSKAYFDRFYIADTIAPEMTLIEGDMDVHLNGTFQDPGAKWTDNVDGEGIVYANEVLDVTKVGPQTLTYTYTDKGGNTATVSRVVTVVGTEDTYELVLPSKKVYNYGEKLDITGAKIVVTDTRGNITELPATEAMFDSFSTESVGEGQQAFFEYEGIIEIYEYEVRDIISSISITTLPTKTTYQYGEELDLTGGKITVEWASGDTTTVELTEAEIKTYNPERLGKQVILLSYAGKMRN